MMPDFFLFFIFSLLFFHLKPFCFVHVRSQYILSSLFYLFFLFLFSLITVKKSFGIYLYVGCSELPTVLITFITLSVDNLLSTYYSYCLLE